MVQGLLRRALGAVKDQASIGLARVSSSRSRYVPALEIAIVKATSHDELVMVDDKHILEIVYLMSFSRGYASVCVSLLARRLSKTKNWVVALKVLLVIHRLLLQDSSVMDSSFDDELMLASRRMLSSSSFKDESKDPLAQLCSSFVRNYALYIDEWLDCFVLGAASQDSSLGQAAGNIVVDFNDYRVDYTTYKQDELVQQHQKSQSSVSETDAGIGMLLKRVPVLQHLLEHVLGCSSGVEVRHPLVRSALTLILRDSFRVYAHVCDGTSTLLNEFFLMVHKDGLKTFAIYSRLGKQADALGELYENCREMGMCSGSEYPSVQKVSREHLVLLEDYLKDATRRNTDQVDTASSDGKTSEEVDEIAPIVLDGKPKQNVDLISLEQQQQQQQPLFSTASETESSWETFASSSEEGGTRANQKSSSASSSSPGNLKSSPKASPGDDSSNDTDGKSLAATAAAAAVDNPAAGNLKTNNCESSDWEVALMDEAKKLSSSLSTASRGRSTSFSLSEWQPGNTSRSSSARGRPQRSRIPLLSMSALPAPFELGSQSSSSFSTANEDLFGSKKRFQQHQRIGIGSPGSYGKLMNKHPQGYKHLLAR
ncbi:hypothetical protein SELMODRAFT_440070 [Selaginella moellendorffii]|uniref:ENTH domain-containing protein n=1 Tax=Selaginella moellendorffii TaxID=88036 RepID=D8R9W6_SELML|nr:putative clathrin assembly protein At4g02650 [Selaginella moellendorffii]EFJ31228.1 hypothetical protein SELMODRAFT_440070 [Selaginella moellendorffii]|eukprot:XP_002967881.1 putative clathrin assembly protein At4g02650 [Selaginella moellendorffii]